MSLSARLRGYADALCGPTIARCLQDAAAALDVKQAENERLREALRGVVDAFSGTGEDLSDCPYLARYGSLPGHDPDATCSYGCQTEPECVTGAPLGGWPLAKALTLLAPVEPEPRTET